ncbi:hypothetical protein APHAL10511_008199 [Amanita phalloides]|nr:hypothetical protein APHAL10511_008199 [Amanita phalloides]
MSRTTRTRAVLAIVITTSVWRCFVAARARPGKKTSVEAAERQRQRQLDLFLNQAQLDVEHWTREIEREAQRREEEEENVPPPYSKHPRLPSWTEHHEHVRAQELGESVSAKENAGIRYPPPSYLP